MGSRSLFIPVYVSTETYIGSDRGEQWGSGTKKWFFFIVDFMLRTAMKANQSYENK
ncbi:hypothetical protein SAMN05428981_105222 [Bacillus sp. OV194]|nr:hypothetical protein SAMN05428981_105222 [Bacillus sp. OV194]